MIPELKPYEYAEKIPYGTIQTFETEMVPYPDHRRRTIRVWTPSDYDGVKRFPVIYMHDGQEVFRGASDLANDGDRAVHSLIEEGLSAIIVAIDTAETRGDELTPQKNRSKALRTLPGSDRPMVLPESTTEYYADFIIRCLKPMIDEHFMTLPDADNTIIAGISGGGSCSYYMILRNPEVFGRAVILSPGLPLFDLGALLQELDEYDLERLKDHRFAFYNGDQTVDVTSVDHVLAVYRKLKEKGFDKDHLVFLLDTRNAHEPQAWRAYLPELFRFVLRKL